MVNIELPKIQNARIDADLLVKIEIRRNMHADESISDVEKDLLITNFVSEEINDIDSYAIHAIIGQLASALNEVANNRW